MRAFHSVRPETVSNVAAQARNTHVSRTISLLIASTVVLQADATIVLGMIERDLTGDGKPELLRVVGVGPTIDNLDVTFTVENDGLAPIQAAHIAKV